MTPPSTAGATSAFVRAPGQWFTLHRGVTLAEALRLMETDGHLHPL